MTERGAYDRRFGRFEIDTDLVSFQPHVVAELLAGCVVVRAESMWVRLVISYVALHPRFDPVVPGCEPPLYTAAVDRRPDGTREITWRKVPGVPPG